MRDGEIDTTVIPATDSPTPFNSIFPSRVFSIAKEFPMVPTRVRGGSFEFAAVAVTSADVDSPVRFRRNGLSRMACILASDGSPEAAGFVVGMFAPLHRAIDSGSTGFAAVQTITIAARANSAVAHVQ